MRELGIDQRHGRGDPITPANRPDHDTHEFNDADRDAVSPSISGSADKQHPHHVPGTRVCGIARADPEATYLLIALDARGRPLIIPVLAVTMASIDVRTEDGDIARALTAGCHSRSRSRLSWLA